MRIVLSADDFGFSQDTVDATIECLEAGALSSASIMANMPATDAALAYARAHPEKSWGVHLTWVSDGPEFPLSPPADIPQLVTPEGRFIGSNNARVRGLLRMLDEAQIERETERQLARVADAGVRLTHVDSHGHLHKFAPFRHALARVLPRFGIRRVRTVQDVYLRRPLKSPTYWLGGWWRWRLAARFASTDHFYMPASAGDERWGEALLAVVRSGTLEVGVHPGRAIAWQDAERRDVLAFAALARSRGIDIVGWGQL